MTGMGLAMALVKWAVIAAVVLYGLVVAFMYLYQRRLVFDVRPQRTAPAEAGFPEAAEKMLTTSDGERIVTWLRPPADERHPLFLMFLGNGDNLGAAAETLREMTLDGSGVLAVGYRGYSGSTGTPTEEGVMLDAEAAYRFATTLVPARRLVLYGYSLGSGVAVPMAVQHPCAALVLLAPFSSALAVARFEYPLLPVDLLMKDQFRSIEVIGKLKVPLLVVHGEKDETVPIRFGRALFAAAPEPKRFVALPGADHLTLFANGALDAIRSFLDELKLR